MSQIIHVLLPPDGQVWIQLGWGWQPGFGPLGWMEPHNEFWRGGWRFGLPLGLNWLVMTGEIVLRMVGSGWRALEWQLNIPLFDGECNTDTQAVNISNLARNGRADSENMFLWELGITLVAECNFTCRMWSPDPFPFADGTNKDISTAQRQLINLGEKNIFTEKLLKAIESG